MKQYIASFFVLCTLISMTLGELVPLPVQAQVVSTPSCYTFTHNLSIGSFLSVATATALTQELSAAGLWNVNTAITGYNSAVASAISAFQEKYASAILAPYGLSVGTGFMGPSTRSVLNNLYGCSAVSTSSTKTQCPAGYVCMPVTHTVPSFSVTPGIVGYPIYTPTTLSTITGNTAATWPFNFTISASSTVYISATPASAVKISTDLAGVPGVSGTAASTMPVDILPDSVLSGDTDIDGGNGLYPTGSFIVPAGTSRDFTVYITENNANNPGNDGGAFVQITGIYYSSSPTASENVTSTTSEVLYTSPNLQSLQSAPVSLIGNNPSGYTPEQESGIL